MTPAELVAFALAAGFQVGEPASFAYSLGGELVCARVSLLDIGPGRVPYAWLVVGGRPPHNVVFRPLDELRPGCDRAARLAGR